MQTFGLPSSPAPSNRNAANNSFSETPAQPAEQFGEVMHRALNDAASQPSQQKSLHPTQADEATRENEKTDDDIRAEKKRARAKRNSEHTATPSQFLGIAAAPVPTPQPAIPQSAGDAHDSNGAKGSATPVSSDSGSAEVLDATSADTKTGDPGKEPSPSGTVEAPASGESSEHSPTATAIVSKELLAQAAQAISDPTEPPDLAKADKSDPQAAKIDGLKGLTDQTGASPPDLRGTSAAKQDITMKKAEKTPKVAGQMEQDLPGITATSGEELPKGQKLSMKDELHGSEKLETVAMELPMRVLTSADSPIPTVTAAAAAAPAPVDSRVLERTHDIVALHAMRLNEYTSDSLHVVVKPGAGIQLSLELRQSARGIEVRAELHKGDFDQLSQHWPELQQRLEARGVRVGTLTTAENFTGGSNQQFQQSKQQSPDQDPLYAGAFAEFALAGSMTEAPAARAARATAYRGWETWA